MNLEPLQPGENDPLHKLFRGLVEQVFQVDIGICDTEVTDYLGRLLSEFVHVDRIYALRTVDGEVIRELSRMEAEAVLGPDIAPLQRRRLVYKYMGDFTLFWTGVYPEHLRPRGRRRLDDFGPFVQQGKRSYVIASELTGPEDLPPAAVLRALSENFEFCVHGLQLVRTSWERAAREHREN